MLKLITFDLDGTIIDDEWAHSKAKTELSRTLGAMGNLDLDYYIGRSNREFWNHVLNKFSLPPHDIEDLVAKQFSLVSQYIREAKQPKTPGLAELLTYLKKNGYVTAVTSGSDVSFVDDILDYLDLLGLFDLKVTKEYVKHVKPAPDIYLAAQRLSGFPGDMALGIEDSKSGCMALKNAGMLCVGFTDNGKNHQDLSVADHRIDTMLDLLPVLQKLTPE